MPVRKHPLHDAREFGCAQAQGVCPMLSYVQMYLPLFTVAWTAAICFSVVSFIMGRSRSQL